MLTAFFNLQSAIGNPTPKAAEVLLKSIQTSEAWGKTSEMVTLVRFVVVLVAALLLPLWAAAAQPDVLISTSGEKFIGQLTSATAAAVTFASESAGEITVPWSKVKELFIRRGVSP